MIERPKHDGGGILWHFGRDLREAKAELPLCSLPPQSLLTGFKVTVLRTNIKIGESICSLCLGMN